HLGDPELLAEIEIDVEDTRAAKDSDAGITEGLERDEAVARGVGLQNFEGAGIKPAVNRALAVGQESVRQTIRPTLPLAADVQKDRLDDSQPKPALGRHDGRELPAAEQKVRCAGSRGAELAPPPVRDLPDRRRNQTMLHVEFGQTIFGAPVIAVLR